MSNTHWERWLVLFLVLAIVFYEPVSGTGNLSQAKQKQNVQLMENEEIAEPSAGPGEGQPGLSAPTEAPTPEPTVTPEPTKAAAYVLVKPAAKYKKGGQKGIRYQRVKGKRVYQLTSYTTDTVALSMSHASTYSIYGGGSRKEVKRKYVTVTSSGRVKCNSKFRDQEINTVIQAKSKLTGEIQYIYIHFKKKLSCKNGKRLSLYEKKSETLSFNYAKKNLKFSISNKKVATANKKGRVVAKKKGTTYLTAKVKGSQKNQIRIRIVVKEEPWLVNDKDTLYDYNDMTEDLRGLVRKYPGKVSLSSLGKSYDKREIWCLRVGSAYAKKKLVIDAAIHGREWKNTQVIMRQTEELLREYSEHRERFQNVCLYIIPMDNPDGVTISQYGYQGLRNKKLQKNVKKIGHCRIWKGNARGVDLNNNFPAGYSKKKQQTPNYAGYPGSKAGSEKETKALMKFIRSMKPSAVINLHSTGSVLYWNFNVDGELYQKLNNLAVKIRSFNGYRMMPKSASTNPGGGFADWLVYEQSIPSVTVETGSVACPLPHSQYRSIYKKNNEMLRWFMLKY